jgi:hypothetical protein
MLLSSSALTFSLPMCFPCAATTNNHRRARVKGFISYAAPFGGAVAAVAPRTSGDLSSLVPAELLTGVSSPIPGLEAVVREVTWNGVQGMASLAMLLPYSAAYANGTDPVSACWWFAAGYQAQHVQTAQVQTS